MIKMLLEERNMYIYGAGTVAELFWLFLKKQNRHMFVKGFIVSNRKNNPETKFSLHVFELNDCLAEMEQSITFLAVQPEYQDEVLRGIPKHIMQNIRVIDVDILLDEIYSNLFSYPIAQNKILFDNMKGQGYGGNPKYIAQKLIEIDRKNELDLVWVVQKGTDYHFPKNIRTVELGTENYYYEVATSKIWIDNVRKNFDIRKRAGQFYIQAWHGAAPIKKVEKDVLHSLSVGYINNAQNDSAMADCFLSGSSFYTELYKRSFWYDGLILEVGLPRHDVFFSKEDIRSKVCNKLGIDKNKGVVLYAPTFRDSYDMSIYDINIVATKSALKQRFGHDFIFLISKHPNNRYQDYSMLNESEYIDVAEYDDFQELLVAADVLITDYSGCMYDFSFTKKPIFLFQKDCSEYIRERNFYIDMKELPYPQAYNQEQLNQLILEFDTDMYIKKVDVFFERMGNFDTGNASEQVARFILELLKRGNE